MLFHTWTFALFFGITWAVFMLVRGSRFSNPWLLLASYVFYGWWHPYYLILILFSTAVDYWCVRAMDHFKPVDSTSGGHGRQIFQSRKFWLIVSLVNNLGTLGFFKYAGFFVQNLNSFFNSSGLGWTIPSPDSWMPFGWEYLLPVGISFYTFQSMSYTIDFYRGHLAVERSFIRFATYVSFFPQLVAGPIERATRLLPQFSESRPVDFRAVSTGAYLFLIGLFKKLALANYLGLFVEQVFAFPEDHSTADLAAATFFFAWQIYFDFSGYSDMARGIARCMGFELCLNFNHPYLAGSLGEFWQRWHISLSTWFRDYVYIPLGGNRAGPWRLYANLFITFLVSGIWHGANWTFLVWGLWHGIGICISRLMSTRMDIRFPAWLSVPVVFVFVWAGWVFFRADSMTQAVYIFERIFSGGWGYCHAPVLMLALVLAVWVYQACSEMPVCRGVMEKEWFQAFMAVLMIVYLFFGAASGGAFIYFQF